MILTEQAKSWKQDRRYFAAMAAVVVGTVFLGFARSYFLAGAIHAKLPSRLVHLHAAVATLWISFLVIQIALIATRRVAWHRQLGMFGAALAVAMVVLALLTATESFARGFTPPGSKSSPATFYVFPVFQAVTFCVLFAAGFLKRSDGAAHKRLMLIATFSLLGAAISRWPFAVIHRVPPLTPLIILFFLLSLAGYDLWTRHRVHRATAIGGAFLVVSQALMFPIGRTQAWHHFAARILNLWNAGG
jgi:uncharacterized membrane protein YozB (DUF420 family)